MQKKNLLSFLKKYNLGGQIESVKLDVNTDNSLETIFSLSSRDMSGRVKLKTFNFDVINADDNQFSVGIYDTTQLNKFVEVLDNDIDLTFVNTNNKFEYIRMNDENGTEIKYNLSELSVINEAWTPSPNKLPEFELDIELSLPLIDKINKSRIALTDTQTFYFDVIDDVCFMVLNDGKNKIKIQIEVSEDSNINKFMEAEKVLFPIDLFKTILNVSKDFETSRLQVSSNNILKLMFDSEDFESEYYLLARLD